VARRFRVHDRASFAALRRDGVRRRARTVTVTRLDDGAEPPRVAYVVGKSVGSAVHRNRLKRRLRALVAAAPLTPGTYLVSAGPRAATLSEQDLRADLAQALA
jgi:ribonuclease P protein component